MIHYKNTFQWNSTGMSRNMLGDTLSDLESHENLVKLTNLQTIAFFICSDDKVTD